MLNNSNRAIEWAVQYVALWSSSSDDGEEALVALAEMLDEAEKRGRECEADLDAPGPAAEAKVSELKRLVGWSDWHDRLEARAEIAERRVAELSDLLSAERDALRAEVARLREVARLVCHAHDVDCAARTDREADAAWCTAIVAARVALATKEER